MPEQVKKILNQILEWWKKFNNKQRILLGSVTGVILIALIILAAVMTTPEKIELYVCKDYAEAAKIKEILASDDSIEYEFDEEKMAFIVTAENEAAASMLLGSNQLSLKNYSIDQVFEGGMTTTEADKTKRYKEYLEEKFADHISQLSMVESCLVSLDIPDDDGTILSREQESKASVQLNLRGEMTSEQAYALALYVATQIGNETTENVTIIDQNAYVLYSGADSQSTMGAVSSQLSIMEKLESFITNRVKDVLVDSRIFSNVTVALNVDIDFDSKEVVKTEIGIPQGLDGGAITQQSLYDLVTNQNYEGGVPGTDTNDDTTYVIEDGQAGHTEISESDTLYDYDRIITTITGNGGDIVYDTSSASVIATRPIVYYEAELKASGELDDMTWEEFQAAHRESKVVEVDSSYIQLVANATGFPASKITFMCYEEPVFIDDPGLGIDIMDFAQLAIALLIFVLLGYVVFRSTRSEKVEELQPEISVESLLESTMEAHEELEGIGYNEKSEVRIMIEKFVDENPDAVASLLRNWLNEEWE